MKLKNLYIDSYRHLQNLTFNFTYPEGHVNAGKPLNKICIIGQSATGKSSLLELIKNQFSKIGEMSIVNNRSFLSHYRLNFKGSLEYLSKNGNIVFNNETVIKDGREFINDQNGGALENLMKDDENLKLLYLSSDIISKEAIGIFNRNPVDISNEILLEKTDNKVVMSFFYKNYFYEFVQKVDEAIWLSLLYKIIEYRKKFTQMASELINKGAIGDMTKLNKEYEKWSKENQNPLIDFAHYFDPILKKLNLKIDLVNTEYSIPIKSKSTDEIIPISALSTGTKGLLLSMFPLFELDTNDAIILLDEPERSLFPDMQIDLMTHYQILAPNAQFIVATHSPFIAAAFEPEERFILYFNDKGEVAVRQGESPIGDDPNDMLTNDFNVNYYNDFGKKAYNDYRELKRKVAKEPESSKKKELIIELAELGDKYKF